MICATLRNAIVAEIRKSTNLRWRISIKKIKKPETKSTVSLRHVEFRDGYQKLTKP